MAISKKRSIRRGFSLIEVLFGIFMVSLCATVLAATMPTANQSRAKANNSTKAISLAQKQIETIRSAGYASITPERLEALGLIDSRVSVSANTFSFTNVDNGIFDNPSTVLPSGIGTVRIRQDALELREVLIILTWQEKGRTKSYSLGTKIANL